MPNCVNFYNDATSAKGCFFNFLKVSSAMCCALDIVPLAKANLEGRQRANHFRAIQLSVPNVVAHFRVVHRDENNIVVDTRDYNIDLNSGEAQSRRNINEKFCFEQKSINFSSLITSSIFSKLLSKSL